MWHFYKATHASSKIDNDDRLKNDLQTQQTNRSDKNHRSRWVEPWSMKINFVFCKAAIMIHSKTLTFIGVKRTSIFVCCILVFCIEFIIQFT